MQVIDRNLTATQVAMIIQNTTEERTILQHLKGNKFSKTENTEIEASVFLSAKSQIFFYQVFLLRASIPLGTVQLLFCLLTDFSSAFLTSLPSVYHFFSTSSLSIHDHLFTPCTTFQAAKQPNPYQPPVLGFQNLLPNITQTNLGLVFVLQVQ